MRKDLLGLEGLTRKEIEQILDKGQEFKIMLQEGKKKFNAVNNVSVCNLFYENSTRTRTSFENAAKFLGANAVNIATSSSSVAKGESLQDTVETLEAIKNSIIVMRHSSSGASRYIASKLKAHVINAGDGMHEHPTQALLDMLTIREHYGTLEGLTVAIIGDIKHSRVARSNIYGLTTMGAKIKLFAPTTMMPMGIDKLSDSVQICTSVEDAIRDSDVVMGLRIQLERQSEGLFPTVAEYYNQFGITDERLKLAKDGAIVTHPGPVNRGVEISYTVVDGQQSKILDQVTSGLAVRMAVIYLMAEDDNAIN